MRIYICIPNEICMTSARHNLRAWRRQPFRWTCVSVSSRQKGRYKTKSNLVRRLTHDGLSSHVAQLWAVLSFIASLLKHLWSSPKSRCAYPKMWHLSGEPWTHDQASTVLVLPPHPPGCPYAKPMHTLNSPSSTAEQILSWEATRNCRRQLRETTQKTRELETRS